MPARSKAQQQAAGAALAAKRGEIPKSRLGRAARQMLSMSEKQLREYAGTSTKRLPKHKKATGKRHTTKRRSSRRRR